MAGPSAAAATSWAGPEQKAHNAQHAELLPNQFISRPFRSSIPVHDADGDEGPLLLLKMPQSSHSRRPSQGQVTSAPPPGMMAPPRGSTSSHSKAATPSPALLREGALSAHLSITRSPGSSQRSEAGTTSEVSAPPGTRRRSVSLTAGGTAAATTAGSTVRRRGNSTSCKTEALLAASIAAAALSAATIGDDTASAAGRIAPAARRHTPHAAGPPPQFVAPAAGQLRSSPTQSSIASGTSQLQHTFLNAVFTKATGHSSSAPASSPQRRQELQHAAGAKLDNAGAPPFRHRSGGQLTSPVTSGGFSAGISFTVSAWGGTGVAEPARTYPPGMFTPQLGVDSFSMAQHARARSSSAGSAVLSMVRDDECDSAPDEDMQRDMLAASGMGGGVPSSATGPPMRVTSTSSNPGRGAGLSASLPTAAGAARGQDSVDLEDLGSVLNPMRLAELTQEAQAAADKRLAMGVEGPQRVVVSFSGNASSVGGGGAGGRGSAASAAKRRSPKKRSVPTYDRPRISSGSVGASGTFPSRPVASVGGAGHRRGGSHGSLNLPASRRSPDLLHKRGLSKASGGSGASRSPGLRTGGATRSKGGAAAPASRMFRASEGESASSRGATSSRERAAGEGTAPVPDFRGGRAAPTARTAVHVSATQWAPQPDEAYPPAPLPVAPLGWDSQEGVVYEGGVHDNVRTHSYNGFFGLDAVPEEHSHGTPPAAPPLTPGCGGVGGLSALADGQSHLSAFSNSHAPGEDSGRHGRARSYSVHSSAFGSYASSVTAFGESLASDSASQQGGGRTASGAPRASRRTRGGPGSMPGKPRRRTSRRASGQSANSCGTRNTRNTRNTRTAPRSRVSNSSSRLHRSAGKGKGGAAGAGGGTPAEPGTPCSRPSAQSQGTANLAQLREVWAQQQEAARERVESQGQHMAAFNPASMVGGLVFSTDGSAPQRVAGTPSHAGAVQSHSSPTPSLMGPGGIPVLLGGVTSHPHTLFAQHVQGGVGTAQTVFSASLSGGLPSHSPQDTALSHSRGYAFPPSAVAAAAPPASVGSSTPRGASAACKRSVAKKKRAGAAAGASSGNSVMSKGQASRVSSASAGMGKKRTTKPKKRTAKTVSREGLDAVETPAPLPPSQPGVGTAQQQWVPWGSEHLALLQLSQVPVQAAEGDNHVTLRPVWRVLHVVALNSGVPPAYAPPPSMGGPRPPVHVPSMAGVMPHMHPGQWGTPRNGPMNGPTDASAYFSGAELSALDGPTGGWHSDSSNAERHGGSGGGAVPPLHLSGARSGSYEGMVGGRRLPARVSPATITSEHCSEAIPLTARRAPPPAEGSFAVGPRSVASGTGRSYRALSSGVEVDPAAASVLCSSVLSAASEGGGAAHSPRSASGISASGVSASAFSVAGGVQAATGGSSPSAVDAGQAKPGRLGQKQGSPGRSALSSQSPLTQPTEE